jgi:hypothetical protein
MATQASIDSQPAAGIQPTYRPALTARSREFRQVGRRRPSAFESMGPATQKPTFQSMDVTSRNEKWHQTPILAAYELILAGPAAMRSCNPYSEGLHQCHAANIDRPLYDRYDPFMG